jgi:hypothetical protein
MIRFLPCEWQAKLVGRDQTAPVGAGASHHYGRQSYEF